MNPRLLVELLPPIVERDRVTVAWRMSEPNPWQSVDAFFLRYEGLDLSIFDPRLFVEIFLAYELKVLRAHDGPVTVTLPLAIPHTVATFWRAYHDADNVEIEPLLPTDAYEPLSISPARPLPPRPIGVFYGGGKDSLSTALALREISDPSAMLMIAFCNPIGPSPRTARLLSERQETWQLRPARERLGVATQLIYTDYQAHFHQHALHLRLNVELYSAGALPALIAHGVEVATLCRDRLEFPIVEGADGVPSFVSPRSRPEYYRAVSGHLRRHLGLRLDLTNLNYLFTGALSLRLLADRFPEQSRMQVKCMSLRTTDRWCLECGKCRSNVHGSLFAGIVDDDFDYDRIVRSHPGIDRVLAYLETEPPRNRFGNAPFHDDVGDRYHAMGHYHNWAGADLSLLAGRISPAAMSRLERMRNGYGNHAFPVLETLSRRSAAQLAHPLADRLNAFLAQTFQLVDALPGKRLVRDADADWAEARDLPLRAELAALADPDRP